MPEIAESLTKVLDSKLTRKGVDLATLSLVSPVLLVFLRHAGCPFCREAMSDLASSRQAIEETGTRIVLVYLGDAKAMDDALERHGLASLDRIHDADRSLYRGFGLKQGSVWQLAGPRVWWRGLNATFIGKHWVGFPAGDPRQMPGMFLLDRCEVVRSFRHSNASDRPLYEAFVQSGLHS
jgi:peroxiredoxin